MNVETMGTLKNIGNSCFMNAVLYALRFTPTFLPNFHHLIVNILLLHQEIEVTASDKCTKCEASEHIKSYTLPEIISVPNHETVDVIIKLHNIFVDLSSSGQSGAKRQSKELQKSIYEINDTFAPLKQQDAHEFLMFLLNCLRDVSSALTNLTSIHPGIFEGIENPASNLCFEYFGKNFIGQRLSVTRCLCCETVLSQIEEMIDVFVALPTGSELDRNFIRDSCVTKQRFGDKIKCSVCMRLCESTMTITFPELPRILIVQIGRFETAVKKVNTVAPTLYQLDCFCSDCDRLPQVAKNDDHQYQLYGMIVHVGKKANSGHYMAYIRSIEGDMEYGCQFDDCCKLNSTQTERIDETEVNWYICNDEIITEVPQSDFDTKVKDEAERKTPYILLYVRKDVVA